MNPQHTYQVRIFIYVDFGASCTVLYSEYLGTVHDFTTRIPLHSKTNLI